MATSMTEPLSHSILAVAAWGLFLSALIYMPIWLPYVGRIGGVNE